MTLEVELKFLLSSKDDFVRFKEAIRLQQEIREGGIPLGGEGEDRVAHQNCFFDSPTFDLRNQDMWLRVRAESPCTKAATERMGPPRYVVAVKGPKKKTAASVAHIREEEERLISKEDGEALMKGQSDIFDFLNDSSLVRELKQVLVGGGSVTKEGQPAVAPAAEFTNERTQLGGQLQLPSGDVVDVTFELDETTFLGEVVQYEVEVELTDVDEVAAEQAVKNLFKSVGITSYAPADGKPNRLYALIESSSGP